MTFYNTLEFEFGCDISLEDNSLISNGMLWNRFKPILKDEAENLVYSIFGEDTFIEIGDYCTRKFADIIGSKPLLLIDCTDCEVKDGKVHKELFRFGFGMEEETNKLCFNFIAIDPLLVDAGIELESYVASKLNPDRCKIFFKEIKELIMKHASELMSIEAAPGEVKK